MLGINGLGMSNISHRTLVVHTCCNRGLKMGLLLKISLLASIVAYVSAGASNCVIGDCPCNSKVINLNKPSEPRNDFTVCCPSTPEEPCSDYLLAGDATETENAYCNCLYTKVYGECLRGADQCHDKPAGLSLSGMPICCEDPNDQAFAEYIATNDTYHCRCKKASNCLADSDCTCNTQTINTKPPGQPPVTQQVCCPASDGTQCSAYLRSGDSYNSSIPAFCDCDFARIKGSCSRGEQCAGKVTGAELNDMPICCANSDYYIDSIEQIPDSDDYQCACAPMQPTPINWYGNCLRGNSCYEKDMIGLFNGVPVCCPDPSLTYDGITQVGSAYVCSCV